LAKAYHDFDNDATLQAAVLFGHGEHFSRGNDVDVVSALAKSGKSFTLDEGHLDPLGRARKLSKPLVAVAHGDTWNMGHEFHLAADIRVASADVRYRQTENAYGRVPGVAPVRWPREVGWANAMRYPLTGGLWDAQTAYRIGVVQKAAPTKPPPSMPRSAQPTGSPPAIRLASRQRRKRRTSRSMTHQTLPLTRNSKRRMCPFFIRKISWKAAGPKLKTGLPSSTADDQLPQIESAHPPIRGWRRHAICATS
jgi:enoyl-CoA hydratase/carnithine racemase